MTTEATPAKTKPANARAAIKALKDASLDPLEWEIGLLRLIPSVKDRIQALTDRHILHAVNGLQMAAEIEAYCDLIAKTVGLKVSSVEELLSRQADLIKELSTAFRGEEGIKKADPYQLSHQIFEWFNRHEASRFFKTQDSKVWLFYLGKIYEIGPNLEFDTIMYRLTKLARIEKPGSLVWYYLQVMCNDKGEPIDMVSWIHTDREKDSIHINMNSAHNKIVRINPHESPALIDNGTNEQAVLLSSSFQIKPFAYQTNDSEAEGFKLIKSLIMDTSPCEKAQRYFLVCWMISIFLMDYQSDRGLLQIIAHTKIGKSKVAERISYLVYGANFVGKGTGAAETRIASNNPVIFLDNVENRNLTQALVDFLLFIANSTHKPKSKSGSDTEVLYQKLSAMAIITSIEAFPGKLPELLNRTFPVILDARYKVHGYMHDECVRSIVKHRNVMLSAIFQMIGRSVLPKLGDRAEWSRKLQMDFPGHNKDRMNEHLCMMLIILEGVLEHLPWAPETPIKKQASDILTHWISYQEEQAHEVSITSNTLLHLMDGLAKEIHIKMRGLKEAEYIEREDLGIAAIEYTDPEYFTTFYLTKPKAEQSDDDDELMVTTQRLELIVTAAELHTLLSRFCLRQGAGRNQYDSPTALGARLSNDREVMEKGGWEFISRRPELAPRYKKTEGQWYWRLSKKLRVR